MEVSEAFFLSLEELGDQLPAFPSPAEAGGRLPPGWSSGQPGQWQGQPEQLFLSTPEVAALLSCRTFVTTVKFLQSFNFRILNSYKIKEKMFVLNYVMEHLF